MVELKTHGELTAMRAAGALVAGTLAAVRVHAVPGTALRELDELAAAFIADRGGLPAFLGYHPPWAPVPYPGVLCTSVNDVVQHGVPDGYRLREGDVLSVDCGAFVDGWCGDSAFTMPVGEGTPADAALIDASRRALDAGIAAARAGGRLGDVCAAVGGVGRHAGYGILAGHGGHGIGRAMHEDPYVPNDGRAGRGMRLRSGLVIAIEPIFHAGGTDGSATDADGWTVRTADGSRATHSEHTVAITDDGPWVLTAATG